MYTRESLPDGAAVGPDSDRGAAGARVTVAAGFGSPADDATVKASTSMTR